MAKIMQGKWLKNGKYKMNKDGTPWEEEVDDPSCLSKDDVIKIIGENNWVKFSKWMHGQGAPVLSNGELGYFEWDVQKFKRHYVDGCPELTIDDTAKIINEKNNKILNNKKSLTKKSVYEKVLSKLFGRENIVVRK